MRHRPKQRSGSWKPAELSTYANKLKRRKSTERAAPEQSGAFFIWSAGSWLGLLWGGQRTTRIGSHSPSDPIPDVQCAFVGLIETPHNTGQRLLQFPHALPLGDGIGYAFIISPIRLRESVADVSFRKIERPRYVFNGLLVKVAHGCLTTSTPRSTSISAS